MEYLSKIRKICDIIFTTLNLDVYMSDAENKPIVELYHSPYPELLSEFWVNYIDQARHFLNTARPFSCIFHEVTGCDLIFLDVHILTPDGNALYLCIGPALTKPYSDAFINMLIRKSGFAPSVRNNVVNFFKSKPFFSTRIRDAFWISCQLLQHASEIDNFTIDVPTVNIPIYELETDFSEYSEKGIAPDEIAVNYENERKTRAFISAGDKKAAKKVLYAGASTDFTYRHPDNPFRAIKNTWLSMNTLCRAAVHDGGAHVTDIHSLHEEFSVRIENSSNMADFTRIGNEMVDRYCDLVIEAGTQGYSAPVKKAITYLHNHYDEPITLPHLAQAISYSEGHLSRSIHQETGMPFNAYLSALRIKKACCLLETGLYSISDVAMQVGFSSYSKFSVEFKKYMNISASEYIKQKGKYITKSPPTEK